MASLTVIWSPTSCRPQPVSADHVRDDARASQLRAQLSAPPRDIAKAVWDSLTAPANILVNPPSYTGRLVRDALYVRFQREAPVEARARALERVGAEVLGSVHVPGIDPLYIIRIPAIVVPGDSASGPLFRARQILEGQPSVRSTLLLGMDALQSPG